MAGFLLRLCNLPSAVVNGRLFSFDSDPPYHLRKIFLLIHNFPHIPTRDPFLAFPNAAQVQWPPLFDLTGAALYFPYSFFSKDPIGFEFLLALWIPLLAALTIWMTYKVTSQLFDSTSGLLAAWVVALSPAHIFISMFGRIDHHVLEPIVILALVWIFVKITQAKQTVIGWSLGGAFVIIGTVLSFPMTYYAYFVSFHLAFLAYAFWGRNVTQRVKVAFVWLWLFVSLLSLGFSFSTLWEAFDPWDVQIPGRFWFLFSILSLSFSAALFGWKSSNPRDQWVGRLGWLGCFAALAFLLQLRGSSFLWGILSRSDENFRLVGENNGFFTEGFRLYAVHFFEYMTPIALLAIFAFKRSTNSLPKIMLLTFFVGLTVQGIVFYRFMPTWIVIAAPFVGHVLSKTRSKIDWKLWGVSAALVSSIFCTVSFCRNQWEEEIHYPSELMPALSWLKKNSPPATADVFNVHLQPTYAVNGKGEYGAFINYWAERPSLDSPFDTELTHKARYKGMRIWMAETEPEAWKLIQSEEVKYLLSYPMTQQYEDFLRVIDMPTGGLPTTELFTPRSLSFLASRLHFLNGSSATFQDREIPALEHFRLIYQNKEERILRGKAFPTFKIFETVLGARIRLRRPLTEMTKLEVSVSDRFNRAWAYQRRLLPGTREFTVPYSTGFTNDWIHVGEQYVLSSKGKRTSFQVDEEAIKSGKIIALSR